MWPGLLLALGVAIPPYDGPKIELTKIADGVYATVFPDEVDAAMNGNGLVVVNDSDVLVVDTQDTPAAARIVIAEIKKITTKPVRYVVNTHFHGDHTGGNAGFANDGAVITAQANVGKRLSEGTTNGLTGAKTPPVTGAGLPSNTYSDELTLKIAGRTAELKHVANAHTDHLRLLDRGQRALDRRHLRDRPLSQHRLCQRWQHQGHDRGLRSLS